MNEEVQQNPVVWGSYEAEVQNVRRFLSERLLWMDKKLGYTYDPDGIGMVHDERTADKEIYDLQGRLVTGRAFSKGIYIVKQGRNTKKVQVQ